MIRCCRASTRISPQGSDDAQADEVCRNCTAGSEGQNRRSQQHLHQGLDTERDNASYAQVVNKFEELEVENKFATQAYTTSLAAFETALAEAQKQETLFRDLHAHRCVREIALYPKRLLDNVRRLRGAVRRVDDQPVRSTGRSATTRSDGQQHMAKSGMHTIGTSLSTYLTDPSAASARSDVWRGARTICALSWRSYFREASMRFRRQPYLLSLDACRAGSLIGILLFAVSTSRASAPSLRDSSLPRTASTLREE